MMPWPPRPEDEPIDWGDEPPEPPPPPSTGRSFRLALAAIYDYLGSTVAASLVAFVLFFAAFSYLSTGFIQLAKGQKETGAVIIAVILVVAPAILSPLTAGLFVLARNMFRREDPHVFDLWRGAVKHLKAAWSLGYSWTFITTILLGDVLFLLSRPGLPMKILGILAAYVLLFWAMMSVYQWPLLVEQGKPLGITLKRSALLAAANPFYTLLFAIIVSGLIVLPMLVFFRYASGPAILIPVSLVWGALIPSLQTVAALEILRKYPEPAPE